jgi:serine/threonine protein kinase
MANSDDPLPGRDNAKPGLPAAVDSGSAHGTDARSPTLDTSVDIPAAGLPRRIGPYRVDRVLGHGGFGVVYLGWDEVLQRQVAIKVPNPQRFTSKNARAQFLHEARLAARLRHPGIVVVFEADIDEEDRCYIVYEFVAGATLADRIKEQNCSPSAAVKLAVDIASALDAAHRQSLVHRDLKPANILLDEEGHPRITDFGLAVDDVSQREQAWVVSGTPVYMAPEQARGETHLLDGRTDIWALGVILYELLTKRKPFFGRDSQEVFKEICEREPKPLRQLAPQVDRTLERIVQTCLQKDPAERYSSATDLLEDLRDWQRLCDNPLPPTVDLPGRAPPHQTEPQPALRAAPMRRRRWVPAAIALGVLALISVTALVASRMNLFGLGDSPSSAGSGDLPRAFRDLPASEIKEGVSYPLLTTRDYERPIWPLKETTAVFAVQPESESITLSTIDLGLMVLGETQARAYKLDFQIAQKPWAGNCGIFWGLRKDSDGAWIFQALTLVRGNADPKTREPAFFWRRQTVRADLRPEADTRLTNIGVGSDQLVVHPGLRPHKLEVTIREGIPIAAAWGGQPLAALQPEAGLELPDAAEYVGQFGILTSGGSTNFRDGHILLIDATRR